MDCCRNIFFAAICFLWNFAFLSQQNNIVFFYIVGKLSVGFYAASFSFKIQKVKSLLNCQGSLMKWWRGNLVVDWHPIQGGVVIILQLLYTKETGSLCQGGHQAQVQTSFYATKNSIPLIFQGTFFTEDMSLWPLPLHQILLLKVARATYQEQIYMLKILHLSLNFTQTSFRHDGSLNTLSWLIPK